MHLFLYDGVCGFCNRSLLFVIRNLESDTFRFAPIQSATGHEVLRRHGKDPEELSSLVVIADYQGQERLYERSTGALFIVDHFAYPWKALRLFRVMPRVVRDWFYDRVAENRYRIFGKFDACPIPDPQLRKLFIDGG
jgi:predicted DCC family thiol-disulfide oxidoreductase YuxK